LFFRALGGVIGRYLVFLRFKLSGLDVNVLFFYVFF
jgi:hypothetical protein